MKDFFCANLNHLKLEVYQESTRNLIFTFMKLIVTFLLFQLMAFGLMAQASPSKKRESATFSKYQVEVTRDTKERITTDSELDKMGMQSTFNLYYTAFLKSDAGNKNYPALLQAHEIDSNNTELFFELAKYNEVIGNEKGKHDFCKKMKSSKLTPALREYAYNTLISVEKNGILVTYGELDTYPIWVLQSTENFRTDVKVLNYDLLINETYRRRKSQELGISFSKKYSKYIEILKDVAVQNVTTSVYYSLSVSHLVLKELKSNLYTTGLALKYSKDPIDNTLILKENWENHFIKKEIPKPKSVESDNQMHLNYILPLLQLNTFYKQQKMQQQSSDIEAIILALASQAGKKEQVKKLLKK